MKSLKELKNYIISNISDDYTTLEKIRYVYLTACTHLQKYTEFFLTLDDKLDETKLPGKKLDKIFEGRLNKDEWNKMICKTAAEFLKDVYNDLNIDSTIVETVNYKKIKGMKNHLHHYFLSVDAGDYNIFLTPLLDFAYTQNHFATLRFGSKMPYLYEGEPFYKGGEIKHKILSKDEIKKIDDKLGFTINVDNDHYAYVDDILKNKKNLYVDLIAKDTDFYKHIINTKIDSLIDFNNWNDIINYICNMTSKRICDITNSGYIDFDINNSDINEWINYINNLYDKDKYNNKDYYFANPNLLFNKATSLCKLIINYDKKVKNFDFNKDDVIKFRASYLRLLNECSKHFIDSKFIYEPKDKDKYVSNTYINHKFKTVFPYLLNCNNEFTEDFNKEGFAEQSEIVKKLIEIIFQNLNKNNLIKDGKISNKFNPVIERVRSYTIRNKVEDKYDLIFCIKDNDCNPHTSTSFWYYFDLANNYFIPTTFNELASNVSKNGDYEIISNSLEEEYEEINDKKNKEKVYKIK